MEFINIFYGPGTVHSFYTHNNVPLGLAFSPPFCRWDLEAQKWKCLAQGLHNEKGWIQGLPRSKACLFPTALPAGVTHEGAELAGSSLVHGFILGPSLKATRFTLVNRKVDLKGLVIQ